MGYTDPSYTKGMRRSYGALLTGVLVVGVALLVAIMILNGFTYFPHSVEPKKLEILRWVFGFNVVTTGAVVVFILAVIFFRHSLPYDPPGIAVGIVTLVAAAVRIARAYYERTAASTRTYPLDGERSGPTCTTAELMANPNCVSRPYLLVALAVVESILLLDIIVYIVLWFMASSKTPKGSSVRIKARYARGQYDPARARGGDDLDDEDVDAAAAVMGRDR